MVIDRAAPGADVREDLSIPLRVVATDLDDRRRGRVRRRARSRRRCWRAPRSPGCTRRSTTTAARWSTVPSSNMVPLSHALVGPDRPDLRAATSPAAGWSTARSARRSTWRSGRSPSPATSASSSSCATRPTSVEVIVLPRPDDDREHLRLLRGAEAHRRGPHASRPGPSTHGRAVKRPPPRSPLVAPPPQPRRLIAAIWHDVTAQGGRQRAPVRYELAGGRWRPGRSRGTRAGRMPRKSVIAAQAASTRPRPARTSAASAAPPPRGSPGEHRDDDPQVEERRDHRGEHADDHQVVHRSRVDAWPRTPRAWRRSRR